MASGADHRVGRTGRQAVNPPRIQVCAGDNYREQSVTPTVSIRAFHASSAVVAGDRYLGQSQFRSLWPDIASKSVSSASSRCSRLLRRRRMSRSSSGRTSPRASTVHVQADRADRADRDYGTAGNLLDPSGEVQVRVVELGLPVAAGRGVEHVKRRPYSSSCCTSRRSLRPLGRPSSRGKEAACGMFAGSVGGLSARPT